jgi:hypothetical protein
MRFAVLYRIAEIRRQAIPLPVRSSSEEHPAFRLLDTEAAGSKLVHHGVDAPKPCFER